MTGFSIDRGADRGEPDSRAPLDEPLMISLVVAAGMVAGLLVPDLASGLSAALLPSLFVIAVASLLPFRAVLVRSLLQFDRPVVIAVLWLQLALPLLVLAGAAVLNVPETIIPFVLLSACSGAVFATPTLAGLFDLDRDRAARIMILSTLLMPISVCVFVGPFVGLDNGAAFRTFGFRVLLFLVVPAVLVLLVHAIERMRRGEGAGGGERPAAPSFDRGAARVGALALGVFAIAIMDGVAQRVASEPWYVLSLFAGALTVNLGMMIATRLGLNGLGEDVAYTASIVAMTRNVGLAFAMTAAFFGPDLALYIALCQVPLLLGPMAVRLTRPAPSRSSEPHLSGGMEPAEIM